MTISVYIPGGLRVDILPRKTRLTVGGFSMEMATRFSMVSRLRCWFGYRAEPRIGGAR